MLKWPLQKVSNHREPLREPCPLCLRGDPRIMWARAHHEVRPISFYRGQMTLAQVASFGHKAQSACSAKLSQQRVPRGLEVNVSRSGPPRPTDSEQRGQPRGRLRSKQKHIHNANMTQRRWRRREQTGKHLDRARHLEGNKQPAGVKFMPLKLASQIAVEHLIRSLLLFLRRSDIQESLN